MIELYQTAKKEYLYSKKRSAKSLRFIWRTFIVASSALWILLFQDNLHRASAKYRREKEVHSGLIQLRLNQHRTTVKDWAHWDDMYEFALSGNEKFIEENVMHTSIAVDNQQLIFAQETKEPKDLKKVELKAELKKCLSKELHIFKTQKLPITDSREIVCKTSERSYLGSITSVLKSDGRGPSRGFLIHLSSFERPSYNNSLNKTFKDIADNLVKHGHFIDRTISTDPLTVIDQKNNIKITSLPAIYESTEKTLPLWLFINTCLWFISIICLAFARNMRMKSLINARELRSRSSIETSSVRSLITYSSVFIEKPTRNYWLALINMSIEMPKTFCTNAESRRYANTILQARLKQDDGHIMAAQDKENNIIWIFQTYSSTESPCEVLKGILSSFEESVNRTPRTCVSAIVSQCNFTNIKGAIDNLTLISANICSAKTLQKVELVSESGNSEAEQIRAVQRLDYFVEQLVTKQEIGHKFENVYNIESAYQTPKKLVYKEILLLLPEEARDQISVGDFICSAEKNNLIHIIDIKMLKLAISILSNKQSHHLMIGINLSAKTFSEKKHFEEIIEILKLTSRPIRQKIIFEITETAFIEDSNVLKPRVQIIRDLDAKIAVDDFGSGYTSFAQIFNLDVDFIKLDLLYTQQLTNPDVDALVSFLKTYSKNRSSQLILEGIETLEQLEHWLSKDIHAFQGYYFD